jgi:hypothetical protein
MNVLNRLIVVFGVVVLILFALMVIVLAWAYSADTIHKLGDFVTYLNDRDTNGTKIIITLGASFVVLVGLSFLVLELAPRGDKTVAVGDVETGTAVLSTAALGRRLEQIVMELPGVEAARAKVAGKKRGVDVDLQVMVDPESDLSAIASEVSRVTQEAVTQRMSVALASPPRLRLYYSSRPAVAQRPARPQRATIQPMADEAGKSARKVRAVPGAGEADANAPPSAESEPQAGEAPPESKEEGQP